VLLLHKSFMVIDAKIIWKKKLKIYYLKHSTAVLQTGYKQFSKNNNKAAIHLFFLVFWNFSKK